MLSSLDFQVVFSGKTWFANDPTILSWVFIQQKYISTQTPFIKSHIHDNHKLGGT